MPVTNDNYDQLKIDKLKYFLEDMAAKGHARPYEVFVDNLKVVPKTDDPKNFDSYEYYMNEDTEKVRILIYNSNLSPRNDQYCFYVQKNLSEKPLNGLGEIETIVQEKLQARDKEYELTQLKKELEVTKQKLEDADEYVEQLEQQLEESKSNKYKLGKIDLVDLGSLVLGKFAEKNAAVLSKVGLEGLANGSTQIEAGKAEETEASFQKKADANNDVKPEHRQYLGWLQQLDESFDEAHLEVVMKILRRFAEDASSLKAVAELLNIQTP
ncbi:MAG TPA: hypothetical protein VGQ09_05905 [Chitinophagaceae bacterium]|jgi:hypothetical protein|nr:hypothetical protein [Chitinophagaceae bacterium]